MLRSLMRLGKRFAPQPLRSCYRGLRSLARELKRTPRRRRDAHHSTRTSFNWIDASAPLNSYLSEVSVERLLPHAESLVEVTNLYREHRFDLLGSGWMHVAHGVPCAGLDGHRYPPKPLANGNRYPLESEVPPGQLAESRAIESLIDSEYRPLDWHLDFKSGYRWSPTAWYLDAFPPPLPGADVKIPWELGRLQHLPQLAAAALLSERGTAGFAPANVYRAEFRNQTLDFLARNPPRFGVNWACTMDVGIRIANLLLAYDLFLAGGAEFDEPFTREFVRCVEDHARHIVNNLEWSPTVRSNHYLANIVGLLFAAAYLPTGPQVDAWLALAVQELIGAVDEQFRPDGANFEASTCYHRLSGEMVTYGTALVLGLTPEKQQSLRGYDARQIQREPKLQLAPLPSYPSPFENASSTPFPPAYWDRLQKMHDFTMALTRPSGEIVQIGDNDAGRFCKPVPRCESSSAREVYQRFQNLDGYRRLPTALPESSVYPLENALKSTGFVAALGGLLNREATEAAADAWEADLIAALAQRADRRDRNRPPLLRVDSSHPSTVTSQPASLRHQLQHISFPEFGVYVYRSPRLFLAIRCGGTGWIEGRGHAHEDQLAVELTIDGVDLVRDPGTFLYTSAQGWRNRYRSRDVHFVPASHRPASATRQASLFALPALVPAECRSFDLHRFEGISAADGVGRIVEILDDCVRIVDRFLDGSQTNALLFQPGVAAPSGITPLSVGFSPGYGWQHRESNSSFDERRSTDAMANVRSRCSTPHGAVAPDASSRP